MQIGLQYRSFMETDMGNHISCSPKSKSATWHIIFISSSEGNYFKLQNPHQYTIQVFCEHGQLPLQFSKVKECFLR